ncbi:hypothetical protein [Azotobacter armeniacus]
MMRDTALALLKRSVEQAHRERLPAGWEASTYQAGSGYEGLLIALPVEHWPSRDEDSAGGLAQRLLELAQHIASKQMATEQAPIASSRTQYPRLACQSTPTIHAFIWNCCRGGYEL